MMLKRLFMNTSLRMRMIVLYTLFAVILVGGITLYSYHFTVNLLKEKEMAILSDSLEYLEKDISMQIKGINEEFMNIFSDISFIDLYRNSMSGGKTPVQQVELSNALTNYFMDIKVRNSMLLDAVYLFQKREIYSSEYRPEYDWEQFLESPYYDVCMESKNRILYGNFEPEQEYFSIARSFYYTNGENSVNPDVGYLSDENEDYSVLVFQLKKSWLQKQIQKEAAKRQTSVIIFDTAGNVVVSEGSIDWLTEEDAAALTNEIRRNTSGVFEGEFIEGQVGINMRQIDFADWSIVYLYDMNILYRQAKQIQTAALFIFVISVLLVICIASFISRTVVTPIRNLAKSMDEVVDNHMVVTFVPKYNDEVAYLGRRFAAMVQKAANLIEEVKQAEKQKQIEELKALQAQINPHFLYNTLDMVYWMDKMEGNDNSANLIADLADFFRLSLNKGEDITTVEREAEHVKKYLEIQKRRMDEKFDYQISLDQTLVKYSVPKLILQPFAENSLLHGFEGMTEKGQIDIRIFKEEEDILIDITDNGCGMSIEKREEINRSRMQGDRSYGYAIENVKARIQLYAGEAYGVWFDTEKMSGTRVRIRFPMNFTQIQDASEGRNDR
ncbi:MAG: sensor histidine kinase [Lachnospiraceae bacterium]|nr:sensor histidine kinase [Lachnospiraceae bacterium]